MKQVKDQGLMSVFDFDARRARPSTELVNFAGWKKRQRLRNETRLLKNSSYQAGLPYL